MKKRLVVIVMALILGGGIAYFMFSREYVSESNKVKVKAFQVGVFTNYDNALKVADRNNGIVVSDDGSVIDLSFLQFQNAYFSRSTFFFPVNLNEFIVLS